MHLLVDSTGLKLCGLAYPCNKVGLTTTRSELIQAVKLSDRWGPPKTPDRREKAMWLLNPFSFD